MSDDRPPGGKAEAVAERRRWTLAHGSPHLRRAIAAGYDCQRLYAHERAALEFPGFVLDFDHRSACRERSCPTEAALDAADAVGPDCRVVWCNIFVRPVADWTPREALVIPAFLGKYRLIRALGPAPAPEP